MAQKAILEQANEEITKVTELLYQQKDQEGYALLNKTLATIAQAIEVIFAWQHEQQMDESTQQEMVDVLTQAMQAMEQKDTVLLADILKYELLERFEVILEEM